ncbi:macrosialin isoform X1 [Carassius carassius]|uniref:macrosialin isoform X1 n=1 Tax=Carassius carassius TaxID=217509 RepID=UPI002868DB18|nr:macrosialin isoform X1 [Carassius carassius]
MKYELSLIVLCMAATALTSGEYSLAPDSAPTTSKPAPTTSKPAPTTSKPAPTTSKPTPTTSKTTTTTLGPKTTTPIPSPTPPTKLVVGHYNFSLDGKLCSMVDLAIGIHVRNGTVNDTFIVQPHKTNVSGECGDRASVITIYFTEGQFILKFRHNETIKKVYVELVEYDLTYAFKTGESIEYSGKNESLELFSVEPGHSYSCQSVTLYMGNGVSLDLTHTKFQAFEFKNKEFGPSELCKADQPNYRVAITVIIILILLIIIAVIFFLIRKKQRTDGYQSL